MEKVNGTKLSRGLSYIVAAVLVLMPFHALLTVWLADTIGHYTLLRLWKEIVMLVLLVPVLYILQSKQSLVTVVRNSRLIKAIGLFIILQFATGLVAYLFDAVSVRALVYGWIIDTRFLLFFILTAVLARECTWLHWHWRTLLVVPAFVVIAFGLLQYFVLPTDVLKHVGYGPDTIPVASFIDNKPDYLRVQSTLRGANPLGAYLVVVIAALVALAVRHKHYREWRIGAAVAAGVVLVLTSSRSAWLGAGAALATIGIIWLSSHAKYRKLFIYSGIALVVVLTAGIITFRNNDLVQNYVFHTDENSRSSQSSNEARASALQDGLVDIARHPFGMGPGTAGPASVHNTAEAGRISENFFLQIGQEVGWIGLALLVFILAAVARHLWLMRSQTLSVMLLASLLGLTIVNLLSHAWADDTLAYLWWGFAGVALAPSIFGDRKYEAREAAQ